MVAVVLASGGGNSSHSTSSAAAGRGFDSASALRWSFDAGGFVSSRPAVANGRVMFGSQNQDVYAVNASSGRQDWDFQTGRLVFSSAAVSGQNVYIGSNDGALYDIGLTNGKQVWKFSTGNSVRSSPRLRASSYTWAAMTPRCTPSTPRPDASAGSSRPASR